MTGISILFHNVQSMSNKINDIDSTLKAWSTPPEILCFAETWVNKDDPMIPIFNSYDHLSQPRLFGKHGGVSILIHKDINYIQLELQDFYVSKIFEVIGAKLLLNNSFLIILCVYRSPNTDIETFFNKFSKLLSKYNEFDFIIAGDFNINLFDECRQTSDFQTILHEFNLFISRQEATRLTHHSQSLLDNIFYSGNLSISMFKNVTPYLPTSDHLPICYTFVLPDKVQLKSRNLKFKLNLSKSSLDKLHQNLGEINWSTQSSFQDFHNTIQLGVSRDCKAQSRRGRPNGKHKPWITKLCVKFSKTKKKLFLISKNSNLHTDNVRYKRFSNDLKSYISTSEKIYYEKRIKSASNTSKCAWTILQEIQGRSKTKSIPFLEANGQKLYSPTTIANALNNYFASTMTTNSACHMPSDVKDSTPILSPTNPQEVAEIIMNLKSKSSTGYDDLPLKPIKYCANILSTPLSDFINVSFESSVYPNSLKISKIIPIAKKSGLLSQPSSYRPVALQSTLSKVFEKVAYRRLLSHISPYLSPSQFGFRPGLSTTDTISYLCNFVSRELNNNKSVSCLFIDLMKAFDSMKHDILLRKLSQIGLSRQDIKWCFSYLTARQQYVDVEGHSSELITTNMGVPQGTILGPLFFLVYVNDIATYVPLHEALQYADDTSCIISSFNMADTMENVCASYASLKLWAEENKLEIQPTKTEIIYFSPIHAPSMIHDGITIDSSPEVKFLGVTLDKHCTWIPHMNYLAKKLSSQLFVIRILSKKLNLESLRCLYFGLFQCHLEYAIECYGGGSPFYMHKLFKIQCKVISLLYDSPDIRQGFINLKIMTIYSLHVLATCRRYLKDHIFTCSSLSNYHLRSSNLIRLPKVNRESFRQSIEYKGPKYLNWVKLNLNLDPSSPVFIKNLKKTLLETPLLKNPE